MATADTQPPTPLPSGGSLAPYPFAAAPDIIRTHQKDAYFTGQLTNTLTDLHRRLLGARATHAVAPELRTSASLIYFALTTLVGNRTLGEEYCDLVQLEGDTGQLPSLHRRAAYIGGSILLPYLTSRLLPVFRNRFRALLDRRLDSLRRNGGKSEENSREVRLLSYLSRHLPSLVNSSSPIQALTLAAFYFSGTYYQLSKRLLALRYVFTRRVRDTPDRAGYEVLGVLLIVQLAVQAYLHIRSTLATSEALRDRSLLGAAGVADVSLDHGGYAPNNDLLLSGAAPGGNRIDIATATHTPLASTPRYQLEEDNKIMGYIKGQQQRKCTLCLEELKDPAATQCGHVFCWECIGDWVREKPECPLCRREAMVQHILPLRVA